MPQSILYPVSSRPTLDFVDALAAASAFSTGPFVGGPIYNIPGVPPIGSRRFLIRAIEYLCVQQVGLEFNFFGSAVGLTDVVATDTFVSRFQFGKANGVQFNKVNVANPLWRFYNDGLAVPYVDLDSVNSQTSPTLHVAVENVDTVAKSAGAAGAVAATFYLEATQGW
jgi:hypothetical protein